MKIIANSYVLAYAGYSTLNKSSRNPMEARREQHETSLGDCRERGGGGYVDEPIMIVLKGLLRTSECNKQFISAENTFCYLALEL